MALSKPQRKLWSTESMMAALGEIEQKELTIRQAAWTDPRTVEEKAKEKEEEREKRKLDRERRKLEKEKKARKKPIEQSP